MPSAARRSPATRRRRRGWPRSSDWACASTCSTRTLRLHDLVREALLAELTQSDPARLAELRRRAADTEPDPVRRIGWLLQAGDTSAAERLAFDHLPPLIVTAGPAQALHLSGQFPPESRQRSPALAYVRALVHWAQWDFHAMLGQFERAVAGFEARGDNERSRLARAQRAMSIMAVGRLARPPPRWRGCAARR